MQESSSLKADKLDLILKKLEQLDLRMKLVESRLENVTLKQTEQDKLYTMLEQILKNQQASFNNDRILGNRINKVISEMSLDSAKALSPTGSVAAKDKLATSVQTSDAQDDEEASNSNTGGYANYVSKKKG